MKLFVLAILGLHMEIGYSHSVRGGGENELGSRRQLKGRSKNAGPKYMEGKEMGRERGGMKAKKGMGEKKEKGKKEVKSKKKNAKKMMSQKKGKKGGQVCPAETPLSGVACSTEDLFCEYGEESCCGETFASIEVRLVGSCFNQQIACKLLCSKNQVCLTLLLLACCLILCSFKCTCFFGSFICLFTDACLDPTCPNTCPIENPLDMAPNPVPCFPAGFSCDYGEETCCGETFASVTVSC